MSAKTAQLVPVAKIPTFIFDPEYKTYLFRLNGRPRCIKNLKSKLLNVQSPADSLGGEFIALNEKDRKGNQIYVMRSHIAA